MSSSVVAAPATTFTDMGMTMDSWLLRLWQTPVLRALQPLLDAFTRNTNRLARRVIVFVVGFWVLHKLQRKLSGPHAEHRPHVYPEKDVRKWMAHRGLVSGVAVDPPLGPNAAQVGCPTPRKKLCVYLTGGSGYLGKVLVRAMGTGDDSTTQGNITEVYLPVRAKRGLSGQERFDKLFKGMLGSGCKKTWVSPEDPIPSDTDVVILNAYATTFDGEIRSTIRENVAPMLALLEQCKALPNLRKVVVVSTAYVQPPLPVPFIKSLIPFSGAEDPEKKYASLLDGTLPWAAEEKDPLNHPYTTHNSYVYSKTLMEHLVTLRYGAQLPITFVRPSIIGPSHDGESGSPFSPGCVMGVVGFSPLGRFISQTGELDIVFVDDVARRVIEAIGAATTYYMSTSGTPASTYTLTTLGNPSKYIWSPPVVLRGIVCSSEIALIRLVLGKKLARRIRNFYDHFHFFCSNTWQFEKAAPTDPQTYVVSLKKWWDAFSEQMALRAKRQDVVA